MTVSQSQPLPSSPDAPVLLVLLPPALNSEGKQTAATITTSLDQLQGQLGTAIRVLKIDGASHPAVVSSFHASQLPSFVLVRRGIELWRQQGLPEGDTIVPMLLSKLEA
ncbi:hypothetical protein PK28_08305 [Hymenobacter sp. DG25B]|uniref:hypothetical protein n=1 Tax=Hymenobacter sp. DG25B TaxID=1385664 RepID=UPI000540AE24|nr:hypothetical protein [Hymenobacter sp. DG25B]AIZ63695.1 hypothetical protein PK28_08305 [Hymenobacter sp. DG25B]